MKLRKIPFLFRFESRLDLDKVHREGPWRFNDFSVDVHDVPPSKVLPRVELFLVPYWLQLYGLPALWQHAYMASYVGYLMRHVLDVGATVWHNTSIGLSFICIRVLMDVRNRLPRGTSVKLDDDTDMKVAFKYERLFNFCYWCGVVDHVVMDCAATTIAKGTFTKYPYEDWLRGIPPRPTAWKPSSSWCSSAPVASDNPFIQPKLVRKLPSLSSSQAKLHLPTPPGFQKMEEKARPSMENSPASLAPILPNSGMPQHKNGFIPPSVSMNFNHGATTKTFKRILREKDGISGDVHGGTGKKKRGMGEVDIGHQEGREGFNAPDHA